MSRKFTPVLIISGVIIGALLCFDGLGSIFPNFQKKSEYDTVNKENNKLAFLFNEAIVDEINSYTYKLSPAEFNDSLANASTDPAEIAKFKKMSKAFQNQGLESPFVKSARDNAQKYFESIQKIESYARYGVTSSTVHNQLELTITFLDKRKVTEVYTGNSVSGLLGPNVLFKVLLKNGKVTQVFSNGVELANPPNYVAADVVTVVNSAMNYDRGVNKNKYYRAEKTKNDIKNEWNNVGKEN